MATIPKPVALDQKIRVAPEWIAEYRAILQDQGGTVLPYRKTRRALTLLQEGGHFFKVAAGLRVAPVLLAFSLHEYAHRWKGKTAALNAAVLRNVRVVAVRSSPLPPFIYLEDEWRKDDRQRVELYRAEAAERGEALLTNGDIAPVFERMRRGETGPAIADSLGLSFETLFVSLCDWDLQRHGF
jgi:hypothetical protein